MSSVIEAKTEAEDLFDGLLLFTRAKTAKEFVFFVTNVYVLHARDLDMSVTEMLGLYVKKQVRDPKHFKSDKVLLSTYALFEDQIKLLLSRRSPVFLKANADNPIKLTMAAIGQIVRDMIKQYKVQVG